MYSQKTIETLRKRLLEETQKAKEKEKILLHVSKGNVKIGKCLNVSNAPLITCSNCKECQFYCYDVKACLQYINVLNARVENTALLIKDMENYFTQLWDIMARRRKNKFLRFHVSGDIIGYKHLDYIVKTAILFPDFKIWTYTKNYKAVNNWIDERGKDALPENLSIMFSEWQGLPMYNPYNMPVFACRMPVDDNERFSKMFKCPGNCDICKANNCGCIKGENTYTDLH